MENNFSEKIVERIEHDHLRPTPRWLIALHRGAILALLVFLLAGGALFASFVLTEVWGLDAELLRLMTHSGVWQALSFVPLLWLVLFVLCLVLGIFFLHEKTHAYRYGLIFVSGLVAAGLVFIGVTLHLSRVPERLEHSVIRRAPPLRTLVIRERPLPRPEDGVLLGHVTRIESPQRLFLVDPRQKNWEVVFTGDQLVHGPKQKLRVGVFVLIRGKQERPGLFQAERMRAYGRKPRFLSNGL